MSRKGSGESGPLTHQELARRIKSYQALIAEWEQAYSESGLKEFKRDIADLEAWVNVLIGPRDWMPGPPRAKQRVGQNQIGCDPGK